MREMYLTALTMLRMAAWRRRIIALLRVLCGGFCVGDACYRWLAIGNPSAFLRTVHDPLPVAMGRFAPWLSAAHTPLFAICGVALETIIACCLLCGALTNLACGLGIFLTLLGYATTGALGAMVGAGSFDLGILFVFLLAFLGLALGNAGQAYGVDGWLSGRLGGWAFLSSSDFEEDVMVVRSGSSLDRKAVHIESPPLQRANPHFSTARLHFCRPASKMRNSPSLHRRRGVYTNESGREA